ncbi:MAG: DUF2202 domain-containing protein [Spirochaetales bacterium]|nr:DUF2202 domain-containing protein [Spirochaetales bacterium]
MKKTESIAAIVIALSVLCMAVPVFAASPDEGDIQHLIFMREEEKLARDVYLTMAALYPQSGVFTTIGTQSEQTHTDTIRDMLEQFGIPDPNPGANILPESIGVFTGKEYGWYFTDKYNTLVSRGRISLLDALYVGAFIEELDMLDIVSCPKVILETADLSGTCRCGLACTDVKAIRTMLTHLLDGSKNHLRSYVKNIEKIIGKGNYEAQVLTQEEVDEILGR